MERFLYRLSQSPHVEKFVLKGALMLTAWHAPVVRPTKDIDLLSHMSNRIEDLEQVVRDVCRQHVEADGLDFDPDSVIGKRIKEDADYEGVRVTFRGSLQNIRLPMRIDVGFGDIVFPSASMTEYPTILDHAPPKLRAYSRETAIAEKFEAMVKLEMANSRMKDFYDIWLLSRQFDFDGTNLATAIEKTFAHRSTKVEVNPVALSHTFATDPAKITQWQAFVRKSRLTGAPSDLATVIEAIAAFLVSPATAAANSRQFQQIWISPGPWKTLP